jgi:hypothetical protein
MSRETPVETAPRTRADAPSLPGTGRGVADSHAILEISIIIEGIADTTSQSL